jgi:hypothetical protein
MGGARRLIIEARLEGDQESSAATDAPTIIAVVERQGRSLAGLGLTLAEGRALLGEVQSVLVSHQSAGSMAGQLTGCRCGAVLAHKDSRSIVMRTVFGKVEIPSPRLWTCNCGAKRGEPRRSVSPLSKAVAQRVTPALAYLQAKWAAHLPYRQAVELLQEALPLDKGISLGSTRRRILAVGHALDAQIERDMVSRPKPEQGDHVRESINVGCVSERSKSKKVISGLSHFYDLQTAVNEVGGAKALLARLDSWTATDDDRAALASIPGGHKAVRNHHNGLAHFYGDTQL